MYKIMLIEDEIKLRNELKIFLENNNFEILIVEDFNNVIYFIENNPCDIILLDIILPNIDGHTLCKKIREKSSVPIIMVTSKNTEFDELLSLNYGTDDFITKPYNPQILLARIERLLKRINQNDQIIKYKDL